jgi:hypothetical protein
VTRSVTRSGTRDEPDRPPSRTRGSRRPRRTAAAETSRTSTVETP